MGELNIPFRRLVVVVTHDADGAIVPEGGPGAGRPHATGPVRCVGCGGRWVAVVPADSPRHDADSGALDILECPGCGRYLGCSE